MSIFTYSKKTVTMSNSLKLIFNIRKAYMLETLQMAASMPRKALQKI